MVKKTQTCLQKTVNRGAWTAGEDEKLVNYMKTNGDKKWRSLPANAGLNRCGKSCRLRWLNYLRPGIKRGNISEEEEDLIIRLHNLIGNRWSLIAGRLPGRTDNEIKNYWNTYLSKKSLTMNQLNLKLNQKPVNHGNAHQSCTPPAPSSVSLAPPEVNWLETLCPYQESEEFHEAHIWRPLTDFVEKDLDIEEFLDFSSMPGLPESDLYGSQERLKEDHNILGVYGNTELLGSSVQCLDEQIACNELDFDTFTRRMDYDDNVRLSFF